MVVADALAADVEKWFSEKRMQRYLKAEEQQAALRNEAGKAYAQTNDRYAAAARGGEQGDGHRVALRQGRVQGPARGQPYRPQPAWAAQGADGAHAIFENDSWACLQGQC